MSGDFSKADKKIIMELREAAARNAGLFNRDMSIYEFQEKVLDGVITDDTGIVHLIVNGTIKPEYNVSVTRRLISRDGQIISFVGLLKLYSPEELRVLVIPKSAL